MRYAWIWLFALNVWGQSDGITATAYRVLVTAPDEARFNVGVNAPFGSTLEQVLVAMKDSGILPTELVGQNITNAGPAASPDQPPGYSTFNFSFTRPADAMAAVSAKLGAFQQAAPAGYSVNFGATLGASLRQYDELRTAALPGLMSEVRRKAQALALAANVVLGPVRSIADSGDPNANPYQFANFGFYSASDFRAYYSITVRFGTQ
jgi:hypothetical protein